MPSFHLPNRSLAIVTVAVLTAVVSGVTAAVLRTDVISPASVPVTWTGLVKTAVSNGILSNIAPPSDPYYAGAHSSQMITAGDGWFEFRKGDSKRDVFVGLSSDTSDTVAPCNAYGLEFYETYVEVRENCVYRKDTSYKAGDRFRITLQGGMVKYSRNGKVFYSSTTSPSYPLVADVMFNVSGARIYGANIATSVSTVTVASPSPTPLSSPTPIATPTPVPSASATPTATPLITATPSPSPIITPSPTPIPTIAPTPFPTLAPVTSSAGSLLGLTDKVAHAPPSTGTYAYNSFKPGVGQSYIDPVFGTKVTRMTDNGGGEGDGSLYVANGLWNADGSYHMYDDSKLGSRVIVSTNTGTVVRRDVGYDTNSQFDPCDADILWKWSGANLVRYNVSTGMDTVEKTFPGTLQSLGGSLDWISADCQNFLLAWNGQLHVWNRTLNSIYSGAITKTIGTGWAAITPDGKYVVVNDDPADNRYSYAIDNTAHTLSSSGVMFWNESSDDHSDLVSASDGKDYLILFENNYVAGVYAVDISLNMAGKTADQQRAANRKLIDLDWSVQSDGHFSCIGRGTLKDWCVISTVSSNDTYNSSTAGWLPFKSEIFAVNAVTGEVRRFAHHRSRSVGMANYFAFPRADVTWAGNAIWFASNFNTQGSTYSDVYRIDIAP